MVEVDFYKAVNTIKQHPSLAPFPGLDPSYVMADSKRSSTLEPKFFLYQDQQGIYYHPFHKCAIAQTQYYEIQSAYGYAGPCATNDNPIFLQNATEAFKSWCHDNNIIMEMIRFHPLAQNWRYYHGEVIPKRKTVYVDLTSTNLLASYEVRVRTAIKKASNNGVTVRFMLPSEFLEFFPTLYSARMHQVAKRDFYFFKQEYFQAICNLDSARCVVAMQDDEVMAASIFLMCGGILEYHLSASTDTGRRLAATNLILHEAFLYAKQHGCTFAHLGGGATEQENDPLLFFKLGFSEKMAPFHIGQYVHDTQIYNELLNKNLI